MNISEDLKRQAIGMWSDWQGPTVYDEQAVRALAGGRSHVQRATSPNQPPRHSTTDSTTTAPPSRGAG